VFSPVLARPVAGGQLAGRVLVAAMPGPEVTPTSRDGLLDLHVRVAVSKHLFLPIGAGFDHKLLRSTRSPAG
jgi:hypothetical protein